MAYWGKAVCEICGKEIQQSGHQGRKKIYCSNKCKMRAPKKRGYLDRYHGRRYYFPNLIKHSK